MHAARKEHLRRRMDAAVCARVGMATAEGFADQMHDWDAQLRHLDAAGRGVDVAAEAWAELRERGHG